MPNKSFVDINYLIKEEIKIDNPKEDENNFFSERNIKIKTKDIEYDLNLKKNKTSSEIKNDKQNKLINNIYSQKYYTPLINLKNSSVLPKKFQLNPLNENNDDDLTKKIFSKIFNKSPIENINNSIEIIESQELIDNNKELEIINKKDELFNLKYETFCLGIFISGLKPSNENNFFIENSFNFIAQCGHKNCSLFLSMKPELIMTYSNKNSNLSQELNYLVANLCFPLGIKICFENPCDNIIKDKKNNIKSQNIYYNVIKNAKDDIYYIATLQYFIKMEIKDFKDKYKIDLFSYYSQINNSDKKDNNIKKVISLINKLSESNVVYIPESISLLSKYPFFIPMQICLNSIISLQSQEEKNNLINHLINEVPTPKKLNQIQFYIPLYKDSIILNHSFNIFKGLSMLDNSEININADNLSISQLNAKLLLEQISIENIIILFQLLLLEQQILIIDNNYQILSEIILILISLIYPLTWTNPFLPILSLNTVQFLQTPVPYIMGLDEYLLNYAYNAKNIYVGKEIIIYNLMSKSFVLSRTKKKANKRDISHEFKLNFLPEKIENFIYYELKKIKILMESNKINDIDLDMEIRLVFIKTMILLIGDYNNYTIYKNDDDKPLFNKEAFIESHKEKQIKLFYEQMAKTQLFNQFLLNEKELYFYNKNKEKTSIDNINNENNIEEKIINNNYIDTSYFKKMIKKYPQFINNEEIRKSSLELDSNVDKISSFQNIKRSKTNKNLKLNFDTKNNISYSTNFYKTPQIIEDKKLSIDFNKKISPEIINITKSYNFNLPMKFNNNNNIDNDLNIKKSFTNKYNNIIIKKSNKIKKYLLYPYFLPKIKKEELNLINQKIICEQISIYNKNYIYQINRETLNNKIYILPKTLYYNFNQIIQKNYYKIEQNKNMNNNITNESTHNIHNNLTEKINCPINNTKSTITNENEIFDSSKNNKKLKNNDVNQKKEGKKVKNKKRRNSQRIEPKFNLIPKTEVNESIELINKCFISCCTNKHCITKNEFILLDNIFSNTHNKNYFANLIIPDMRIKNKNQHKQLISTSFEDLKIIMKKCLEKLTHEENEIGRLLTIACFSYYTIDKNNNSFYLYQCFNEGAVYPCKLWLIDEFWMEFFKIEMNEANVKEDELIKNYDNNLSENFDYDKSVIEFKSKYAILLENSLYLSKIMYKLNLNQIFITNVFEKMILPVYECDYYNINNIMKNILYLFGKN